MLLIKYSSQAPLNVSDIIFSIDGFINIHLSKMKYVESKILAKLGTIDSIELNLLRMLKCDIEICNIHGNKEMHEF